MSGRQDKEKGVNVQVLLRCRPLNDDEKRNNTSKVVVKCNEMLREVVVSQSNAGKIIDKVFTFDKVFGPKTQQKDLYDQAIVPIVNEVLEGFNCTIFAYGQTGTGKTYTMEGECKRSKSGPNLELPTGAGVIPRAVKQIFDTLESQNAEYSVKVTFLELYNEEITDLLAPDDISKAALEDKPKKQLPLMEDGKGGVLVRGLEEEIVTSASEIFNLLERGSAKRRTAETLLNKQSSRSHSLFSITIHIKESTPEGEELIKCGKLNLVDLAGSENISRSGAREGRAREAGEINKSLLTLGRVINALVEHLGHIPYRDSKLTRLLRDSLGGRTKTCIIATVSPAVNCLEETLSTLDYAHRAKNIRNKPEVNQKVTKTTLIKDLYSEIERLKAEVYAAREKNGVYIPKERYYQEEGERKAMKEQIIKMESMLKNSQKELEDLKEKFTAQVQECSDLSSKLDTTEKTLDETGKMLTDAENELNRCQYDLKERDFIIVEQKKAENALAHQACVLRSDLEKSLKDFALLSTKIANEDKLHADNKLVVNNFQENLAQQISYLCEMVAKSVSGQTEQLRCAEGLCHSLLEMRTKLVMDIKEKVAALRASHTSHMEAVHNIVCLHKASCNAGLDKISFISCSDERAMKQFLESATVEAKSIYVDLQNSLSTHSKEMTLFAGELQKRFNASIEHTRNIAECTLGLVHKLVEESKGLENFASTADELQMKSIDEFQKTYEEHLKSVQENFISDMTNSFSNLIRDHKELFGARLVGLRDIAAGNKKLLEGHVSSMESITTSVKRKWEEFVMQAESNVKDSAEYSAAKHCRIDSLLQQCISNAESTFSHWRSTHESVNEMASKHASTMVSLTRNALESGEQHDAEIDAARSAAEQVVTEISEDIVQHVDCISKQEQESVSGILGAVKSHADILDVFRENHTCQATSIRDRAQEIFEHKYMDYEPTGSTPLRCDLDVPSLGVIETLKSMPMEELSKEFRKNNSFETFTATEGKPSN